MTVHETDAGQRPTPTPKKQRWQFSLRWLMIVVLFFLICVSHIRTSLDLRESKRIIKQQATEIEAMRATLGVFEVKDATKIHVLSVPSKEAHTYRWRLHLPPRQKDYEICHTNFDIPAAGVPTDHYAFQKMELHASYGLPQIGETFSVEVFCRRNVEGDYEWCIRHPHGEQSEPEPMIAGDLNAAKARLLVAAYKCAGPQIFDPTEPLVLIRSRICPDTKLMNGEFPENEPLPGLIVWIR